MNNYTNYVLTSNGFKKDFNLKPTDFTYNRSGRHTRVVSKTTTKTPPTAFTTITTELDDIPVHVRNDRKIFTVDTTTFEKGFKRVVDLTEDNWLFSPWVSREIMSPKQSFDLSKYVDNHHDSFKIYLFNNEILEIAAKLNIPFHAVKELLVREAAEFSEHLNDLRYYLYTQYNIIENPLETETSFIKFKKYVLDNHVHTMQRYLQIDSKFISFLVASLTKASYSQNTYNKNNRYKICYKFDKKDEPLVLNLCRFLQEVNVKFSTDSTLTTVEVFNKPLYKLITEGFQRDLSFLMQLDDDMYNLFVSSLFKASSKVKLPLEVLLQIKEAFLYSKKVVSVKDSPLTGYEATLITEDSLTSLENVVIFEKEGYFTKIASIHSFISAIDFSFVTTEDQEALFINCITRG